MVPVVTAIPTPGSVITSCSEYASGNLVDKADTTGATKLNPTTRTQLIKPYGHLSLKTDATGSQAWAATQTTGIEIWSPLAKELQTSTFAYSWQIPHDAPADSIYYVGLKCFVGVNAYVAAWKITTGTNVEFVSTSAALKFPTGASDLILTTIAATTSTNAWVAESELSTPTGFSSSPDPAKWEPVYKYSGKKGEGLKVTFP